MSGSWSPGSLWARLAAAFRSMKVRVFLAAFVVALAGLVAAARAKDSRRRQNEYAAQAAADPGLIAKLFELAKQRPFVAAGAAAAVGVFALRNPALVAAVIKAFFDAPGGSPPPPRSR